MGEIIKKNKDEKKIIANFQPPQQPEIIRETSKKILLGLHEQYRKIYNSFIPRCRCFNAEDMASFDVRFMSLD